MLLYVHIPFCKKKCRYCAFTSFEEYKNQEKKYVDLLLKEAEYRKNEFSEDVESVFIGGGTPSLLTPETMLYLVNSLFEILSVGKPAEFTVESNPGTVTDQWLSASVNAGMNRLSLGMQAFQPELLRALGRIHTYESVKETVRIARTFGVSNINIDLIFGIPGQTLKQWEETLDAALSLNPTHISAYGLIPEDHTPLKSDLEAGILTLPDAELERTMYDSAIDILLRNGLKQYEISNFSKPGFECRHNIGYWKQVPYVGLGVSSSSMEVLRTGKEGMICRRRSNPCSMQEYETMVTGNKSVIDDEYILPAESRFETMMLGLRMNEGVSEDCFEKMHGISVENVFGKKLHLLEEQQLMIHSGRFWKLTRRGFDIQNSILVELMDY